VSSFSIVEEELTYLDGSRSCDQFSRGANSTAILVLSTQDLCTVYDGGRRDISGQQRHLNLPVFRSARRVLTEVARPLESIGQMGGRDR
jgi:hypothetical protein